MKEKYFLLPGAIETASKTVRDIKTEYLSMPSQSLNRQLLNERTTANLRGPAFKIRNFIISVGFRDDIIIKRAFR